jgi:hypothetical protein
MPKRLQRRYPLACNGAGGTNVIWYMNGAAWSESAELLPVADLNWKIVSR